MFALAQRGETQLFYLALPQVRAACKTTQSLSFFLINVALKLRRAPKHLLANDALLAAGVLQGLQF